VASDEWLEAEVEEWRPQLEEVAYSREERRERKALRAGV